MPKRKNFTRTLSLLLILFATFQAHADLGIVTWNLKHLGREKQNLDDVSLMLAGRSPEGQFVAGTFQKGPDLVLLQEVNNTESADDPTPKTKKRTSTAAVRTLQENLLKYTHEKYCAGFSKPIKVAGYDSHERYAMLWKVSAINFITVKGDILKDCETKGAVVLPTAERSDLELKMQRPPAAAQFLEVETQKRFLAATVHLVPNDKDRGKDPRDEVPYLFLNVMTFSSGRFDAQQLPKIVTGDFNLNSGAPAFREWLDSSVAGEFRMAKNYPALAGQADFTAVLSSKQKTSLQARKRDFSAAFDNVFLQDVGLVGEATVPNPYEVFKNRTIGQIFNEISDHAPVFIKVHLN